MVTITSLATTLLRPAASTAETCCSALAPPRSPASAQSTSQPSAPQSPPRTSPNAGLRTSLLGPAPSTAAPPYQSAIVDFKLPHQSLTSAGSARNPIFFANHSNIDRLWDIWKKQGGKHEDYSDEDFRQESFLFCDENARLVRVRVKVKDCLDSEKLRYTYQNVEIPWLNTPPISKSPAPAKQTVPEATFPVSLDQSAVSMTVKRPGMSRSKKEKDEKEEVLMVDGIEYNSETYIKFDVYINAPVLGGIGPESSEFAGSFVNVPHLHKSTDQSTIQVKTKLRLGITNLIEELNVDANESLMVTLMPRKRVVRVGGAQIELAA